MRRALFLCIVFLVGCTTGSQYMSQQRAQDLALAACNRGNSRALAAPSSVSAQLLTLDAARKQLAQTGGGNDGRSPDMIVWLVRAQGTWALSGGPPTPVGATPAPLSTFHSCSVILDAVTGDEIGEVLSANISIVVALRFAPAPWPQGAASHSQMPPPHPPYLE